MMVQLTIANIGQLQKKSKELLSISRWLRTLSIIAGLLWMITDSVFFLGLVSIFAVSSLITTKMHRKKSSAINNKVAEALKKEGYSDTIPIWNGYYHTWYERTCVEVQFVKIHMHHVGVWIRPLPQE